MIAVLDTNVWLDWLVFGDAGVAPLRAAHAAGRLAIASDADLRAELAVVLARTPFGLDPAAVARALATHDAAARPLWALPGASPRAPLALACRDPDDQKFLEVAVAARAAWLVTKDRDLLVLRRRARRAHGLSIGPPAQLPLEAADAQRC